MSYQIETSLSNKDEDHDYLLDDYKPARPVRWYTTERYGFISTILVAALVFLLVILNLLTLQGLRRKDETKSTIDTRMFGSCKSALPNSTKHQSRNPSRWRSHHPDHAHTDTLQLTGPPHRRRRLEYLQNQWLCRFTSLMDLRFDLRQRSFRSTDAQRLLQRHIRRRRDASTPLPDVCTDARARAT